MNGSTLWRRSMFHIPKMRRRWKLIMVKTVWFWPKLTFLSSKKAPNHETTMKMTRILKLLANSLVRESVRYLWLFFRCSLALDLTRNNIQPLESMACGFMISPPSITVMWIWQRWLVLESVKPTEEWSSIWPIIAMLQKTRKSLPINPPIWSWLNATLSLCTKVISRTRTSLWWKFWLHSRTCSVKQLLERKNISFWRGCYSWCSCCCGLLGWWGQEVFQVDHRELLLYTFDEWYDCC